MGIAHLTLAVVVAVSLGTGTTQALAIALGELEAVPGSAPPYVFRLALIPPPHGAASLAAVTVRQPPDVISIATRNVVELRLPALSDIELEVSQGGQTLNRLLLKSELQAARLRLEEVPTSPPQFAKAKGRDRPLSEAMPLSAAAQEAVDRTLLEHEMAGIRQAMQDLAGRVVAWEGSPSPPAALDEAIAATTVPLLLGGLVIAAMTALIIGYVMQHQTIHRERRRRRALSVSLRRMQEQRVAVVPILSTGLPAPQSLLVEDAPQPVSVLQGLRVAYRTTQRLRLRVKSGRGEAAQERAVEGIRHLAQTSQRGPSSPAEFVEALAQLRHELMRLQRKVPPSTISSRPNDGSGPRSRLPRSL